VQHRFRLAPAAIRPSRDGPAKRLRRAGWLFIGVPDPETVAEHSFRVAIIGIALATLEGADPNRTAVLCLLHDSAESRTGDIEAVGRAYVATSSPEVVSTHQTSAMPDALPDVSRSWPVPTRTPSRTYAARLTARRL
jgi:5'-deoxynucleotidase YfbR-like HD superfamily hydrolase